MNRTVDHFEKMSFADLKRVVEHAYDEIFVCNGNYEVIYVNKACERHYGMTQDDLISKDYFKLMASDCWYPAVLPAVYQEKRQITVEQTTYLGQKLITTAVPLFDENNKIDFVVMSVKEAVTDITLQREKIINHMNNNKGEIVDESIFNKDNVIDFVDNPIVFRSDVMKKLIEFSRRVSKVDTTILIHGESGTGKSILAKYIHERSPRKNAPFLTINCAAIPEDLLESELFGYAKGAFTGANNDGKVGLIKLADKGTLFLDEVGELSLRLQAKLLHVIQNKQIMPIGGHKLNNVDIRIITATNKDLYDLVQNKLFREDLFWRLNVVEIEIPPLRKRQEDVVALSNFFLNKINTVYKLSKSLSEDCKIFFRNYGWPGNVRQLENLIERLVVTSNASIIQSSELPKILLFNKEPVSTEVPLDKSLKEALAEYEGRVVRAAYERDKTTRKMAETLEISQSTASRLVRKHCE